MTLNDPGGHFTGLSAIEWNMLYLVVMTRSAANIGFKFKKSSNKDEGLLKIAGSMCANILETVPDSDTVTADNQQEIIVCTWTVE